MKSATAYCTKWAQNIDPQYKFMFTPDIRSWLRALLWNTWRKSCIPYVCLRFTIRNYIRLTWYPVRLNSRCTGKDVTQKVSFGVRFTGTVWSYNNVKNTIRTSVLTTLSFTTWMPNPAGISAAAMPMNMPPVNAEPDAANSEGFKFGHGWEKALMVRFTASDIFAKVLLMMFRITGRECAAVLLYIIVRLLLITCKYSYLFYSESLNTIVDSICCGPVWFN